jgi:hypothetical protein
MSIHIYKLSPGRPKEKKRKKKNPNSDDVAPGVQHTWRLAN